LLNQYLNIYLIFQSKAKLSDKLFLLSKMSSPLSQIYCVKYADHSPGRVVHISLQRNPMILRLDNSVIVLEDKKQNLM
jgi:hypothetical protein